MHRPLSTNSLPIALAAVVAASLATPGHAADKFKVTSVACEMFWYSKHTPTISYDIVEDRQADYNTNPPADYFRQAAERTREYCDRTSPGQQSLYGAPRVIRGIWFQSNDARFKALYSFDTNAIDVGAGVINSIGDKYAAERRHEAQLEEIRTREARAQALKDAQEKARQAKLAADKAREDAFLARTDLQIARLGTEVVKANFTSVQNVRTNPFHFRNLGLAVVATQFNRMVTANMAQFGNELAPIFVHIDDVDRFTQSGEPVMLALRVTRREEVERSYGTLPEIVLSALKAEAIYGEYVGAYSCPAGDCRHLLDVPPS